MSASHKMYYSKSFSPEDTIRHALFACGIEESEKVEVPEVMHALSEAGYEIRRQSTVSRISPANYPD